MTVGLVIVSHSAALAAGVRELAGQMAPAVTIAVAGGTEGGALGTSFELVAAAFEKADTGDGVVVLYDLGSALLTTETALEFADPNAAERIRVVDAPLVEGAVAAAVAAQSSAALQAVADAARAAGAGWGAGTGSNADDGTPPTASNSQSNSGSASSTASATATVADADGIHARPASILARTAAARDGTTVTVGRVGEAAVDLTNVLAVIGLGLRAGETVSIIGSGPDSTDGVTEIAALIAAGLDSAPPAVTR